MVRNVNGRLRKLEALTKEDPGRGISAASRRLIEIEVGMGYDPAGLQDWPTPAELEKLEAEARAADPDFWQKMDSDLERAYGDKL